MVCIPLTILPDSCIFDNSVNPDAVGFPDCLSSHDPQNIYGQEIGWMSEFASGLTPAIALNDRREITQNYVLILTVLPSLGTIHDT